MTLDPKSEAAVQRWVGAAPPLSEKQKDIISAVFAGALEAGAAVERWAEQDELQRRQDEAVRRAG